MNNQLNQKLKESQNRVENLTCQVSQGYNDRETPVKSIYSGAEININDPSLGSYAATSNKMQNNRGDAKEYQIYSLNIDNKRLKQENSDMKVQILDLQQDLNYLQHSI